MCMYMHGMKQLLMLQFNSQIIWSVRFSSVAQLCPTLCDPMNCSTPTPRVHPNPCPLCRWCHPTSSSFVTLFSCIQPFPASESFPVSQLFASGGQSIGVSASTSVFLMNTQEWSPLGWTGWISCSAMGSRESSHARLVGAASLLWACFLACEMAGCLPADLQVAVVWLEHRCVSGPQMARSKYVSVRFSYFHFYGTSIF